jgi:hypothetical protein
MIARVAVVTNFNGQCFAELPLTDIGMTTQYPRGGASKAEYCPTFVIAAIMRLAGNTKIL